jgi:4-hydroxy-tetrahydrodipicolinate reductase
VGHRVIQWSTGNVGRYALRHIIGHPELELAGVWVHSEKKSGSDAGELAGTDPVGIVATNDADALLELDADCVCYTATANVRLIEAIDDICRILRAGKNVVSSSVVALVHPDGMGPEIRQRIEDACREGNASFFTSGIDPGFANDVLPLVLSGLAERWEEIRVQEIVNYATYDQPEVVFDTMGFGKPLDAQAVLFIPGSLEMAWGGTVRLIAQGLGVELDGIEAWHERSPAPESFDVPIGHVEKGTMAALRFEVRGMVDGVARIVVEHVTRLRDDLEPDWPQSAGGYHVLVKGVPSIEVKLDMADEHGDHAVGGVVLTATRLVNAIPAVCEAGPGFLSALDLPLVTGRGLMGSWPPERA